jgi:hypothetical protein
VTRAALISEFGIDGVGGAHTIAELYEANERDDELARALSGMRVGEELEYGGGGGWAAFTIERLS